MPVECSTRNRHDAENLHDDARSESGPVAFPERSSSTERDEPLPQRHPSAGRTIDGGPGGWRPALREAGRGQVVLRLYAAIRDRNWNTIEPRFLSYELDQNDDGFAVRFVAENVSNDVDFEWQGSITGTPDGVITATMDGVARKDFLRNRIGWCVLHPMELAGVQATVETPTGTVDGAFPDLISPHQPFIDMQSITHATPSGEIIDPVRRRSLGDGGSAQLDRRLLQDLFHAAAAAVPGRDHARRPRLAASDHRGARRRGRGSCHRRTGAGHRRFLARPNHPADRSRAWPATVSRSADEDIALLRALNPAHLHLALDLTESDWRQSLARAQQEAGGARRRAGNRSHRRLRWRWIAATSPLPWRDPMSTSPGCWSLPTARWSPTRRSRPRRARRLREAGVKTLVGGGTRAYFTELNRATLPLDAMDVVSYTINPQVHAFDNASMTETLAAQPETVRSARAIVGERPLAVGPITLRPPFNPNATGPNRNRRPGELPSSVDYRQPSLFAAGWLAGSVNALGNAGVGCAHLLRDNRLERAHRAARSPAAGRQVPLLAGDGVPRLSRAGRRRRFPGWADPAGHVERSACASQALALRDGDRVRVILANMSDEPLTVSLEIPGAGDATVRRLDDRTVYARGHRSESHSAVRREPIAVER